MTPSSHTLAQRDDYRWHPQPSAAALIRKLVDDCLSHCPAMAEFSDRLKTETGTRFCDWLAYITVPKTSSLTAELETCGFVEQLNVAGEGADDAVTSSVWQHPLGLFPTVVAVPQTQRSSCYFRVESVTDFQTANSGFVAIDVLGDERSLTRGVCIFRSTDFEWWVIEQEGARVWPLTPSRTCDRRARAFWKEQFSTRPRSGRDLESAFVAAEELFQNAGREIGQDAACQLFFACEREYWQQRNHAARVQKARQDRLGLGWANHDHHTYRSSRRGFTGLIHFFESLGFVIRERFYAGKEAGWGAQVLEHPRTGIIIFTDVDLSPDEVFIDFAHKPLAERTQLGTIGLWCGLHGEAFLEAGMHHLECQFDFEAARDQLAASGIRTMRPFTDLPYLRQAFTEGESWSIAPDRLDDLLSAGRITIPQAQLFRSHGAVGSHLEILQRDDGYKGFNQKGINEIIRFTDPRSLLT